MLFNSIDFAIFLPIVFALYWFITARNLRLQNTLIVVSSLIFYGWWDWRFLSLLLFSAFVDFFVGLALEKEENQTNRKLLLSISLVLNLGLLAFFKYFNFFISNFKSAFSIFGYALDLPSLDLILPVGISFYTFQSLSYGIDVYRRKLEPSRDWIAFLAFVSFFPQLVAGPIERATHLLPQFFAKRIFDYEKAVGGMRLILWGFFKKIVIADNAAYFVNDIFANNANYSGGTLILGAVLFSFQIYCDFSGYSDIAIGLARLFGFELMRNFKYPYFSKNVGEFWQRWHISLSTWFRDYVYLPLGGNRGSLIFRLRNVMIVFLVSGFWHGANWTFIAWGLVNALFFVPLVVMKERKIKTLNQEKLLPEIGDIVRMGFTFILITFAWIFFRAESLSHAFQYIEGIFCSSHFLEIHSKSTFDNSIIPLICYLFFFIVLEWFSRHSEYVIHPYLLQDKWYLTPVRFGLYFFILLVIMLNIKNEASNFIYFQF